MLYEALEIVGYADAGRSAGVEACESAVAKGDLIVQPYEFHEHIRNKDSKVFGIAGFVGAGHGFGSRRGASRAFWSG